MSKWSIKPLGEICEINPRSSGSEKLGPAQEVSFVPMAAVDEITGLISAPETRPAAECLKGFTAFQDGDVLFAKITPCMENGKAAIARNLIGGRGFGSTEFHVLRPKAGVLAEWVFAFIRQPAFRDAAKRSFTGSAGQQRVPTDFLRAVPIPLPPLAEQERIVRLLDEAAALRRLRTQADERTAAVLAAIFDVEFGAPKENPKGWPLRRLTEVCNPKQWPTISGEQLTETGYPVYGANGRIGFYSSFNHESPTVLITCRGATCGTINVSEPNSYVTGNAMCCDDPDESLITRDFLEWTLRVRGLDDAITGAAQPQITRKNLEPVLLPLPPLERQRAFSTRVAEIRALEAEQANSRKRLDDLFQSLLQRAFSGDL